MVPVVLGPTASGKTEVALRLAEAMGGEIIVADSRQVYRRFEIGSNKPSREQRARVRFHLVDFVDPRESFSAFQFVRCAGEAIDDILNRGRQPIVEGATMLYVRALTEGLDLASVPPSPERRRQLSAMSTAQLVDRLRQLDPEATVDTRNRVRLIRAIEIVESTGRPVAHARGKTDPRWRFVKVALRLALDDLDRRLAVRSREQLARGLVPELEHALEEGVPIDAQVLSGVGVADVVHSKEAGESPAQLELRVTRSNQRLARRQLRWLRSDADVNWFDAEPDPVPDIVGFLRGLNS